MKQIVAILLMVTLSGCATFDSVLDFADHFIWDDDEPRTGTVIMDDGTEYEVVIEDVLRENGLISVQLDKSQEEG